MIGHFTGETSALLLPKAMQILRQLGRERQVASVKAFDLANAGPGNLGVIEDLHLSIREDNHWFLPRSAEAQPVAA